MNGKLKGAMLAAAAASLFMAGHVLADDAAKPATSIKCMGLNACASKGACKSAKNACAGHNSCKGQGMTFTGSEEECKAKGGTVEK